MRYFSRQLEDKHIVGGPGPYQNGNACQRGSTPVMANVRAERLEPVYPDSSNKIYLKKNNTHTPGPNDRPPKLPD